MASRLIKEAGSLIIASRAAGKLRSNGNHIVVTTDACGNHIDIKSGVTEDYEVLMLKRSSGNTFMPNAYVFPGGGYDTADCCPGWLRLMDRCGLTHDTLVQHFRLLDNERPGSYTRLAYKLRVEYPSINNTTSNGLHLNTLNNTGNEYNLNTNSSRTTSYNSRNIINNNNIGESMENMNTIFSDKSSNKFDIIPLIPELALRITSLRETFEETGLLLAVPVENGRLGSPLAITHEKTQGIDAEHDYGDEYTNTFGGESLESWRTAVQEDASKFLEMFASTCPTLLPWCWGLVEWWGWLTPATYPARRYDTVFYTAILPHTVLSGATLSCSKESDALELHTPSGVLESWLDTRILLAPPQVYEFGRLCRLKQLKQLQEQVQGRVDYANNYNNSSSNMTNSSGSNSSSSNNSIRSNGKSTNNNANNSTNTTSSSSISRSSSSPRVSAPIDTWVPQVYKTQDGIVSVLPGDCLYDPAYLTSPGKMPELQYTLKELRGIPTLYTAPASTEPPSASTEPPSASTEPPSASTEPPPASTEPPSASTEPPPASTEPPPVCRLNRLETQGSSLCHTVVNIPLQWGQTRPLNLEERDVDVEVTSLDGRGSA